jgi:DNA-binding NtrC family response regulator
MRILVMDDYKSHGESLAEFLGTKGHEAIYAETCADAEWLLDLMKFDFALLDFDMPGMSGPSVAAKLSKRFPHLRAAIMSAKAPTGTRRNELGSLDFLQKPVRPEALIEVLRRVQEQLAGVALVQRSTFSVVKYK